MELNLNVNESRENMLDKILSVRYYHIHEILVLGKAILNTPSCRLGSEIGFYANM